MTIGILADVDAGKAILVEQISMGLIRMLDRVNQKDAFPDYSNMEGEDDITAFKLGNQNYFLKVKIEYL